MQFDRLEFGNINSAALQAKSSSSAQMLLIQHVVHCTRCKGKQALKCECVCMKIAFAVDWSNRLIGSLWLFECVALWFHCSICGLIDKIYYMRKIIATRRNILLKCSWEIWYRNIFIWSKFYYICARIYFLLFYCIRRWWYSMDIGMENWTQFTIHLMNLNVPMYMCCRFRPTLM